MKPNRKKGISPIPIIITMLLVALTQLSGPVETESFARREYVLGVEISAGENHIVGLEMPKPSKTMDLGAGNVVGIGDNSYGQLNVEGWEGIVQLSAGKNHTLGLKADGTVLATGDNSHGQIDVEDWRSVEVIGAGGNHTIGLTGYYGPESFDIAKDILVTGSDNFGELGTTEW